MKKKILFMVQVPPPVHGAALRNLSLFESNFLHNHFNIKLAPLAFADSIYTIGKFSIRKILKSFWYALQLIGKLVSFRPGIAYFTLTPAGGAFYRDCLFVLILKMSNTHIIYHLRGMGVSTARNKNRLNKILYNFVFKNTYVVCLSQKQLQDVQGLKYKKHFVVPNGIKVETDPDWQSINNTGKKNLLFLSNFIRSKGVYEFLEALKQLKSNQVPFNALLVGADYDVTKADIQKYIQEQNLCDCVTVRGPAFKSEKYQIICSADIFVFPTYYPFELFPGVILEAMQCGKPVISTYHGVIEDIIDNNVNGLLVHPKDVIELVQKIKYLIDNPELVLSMGKKASEKFYSEYTLAKFEKNMKDVFAEV